MNNAIEIQHLITHNLTTTARKRTIKQKLIKVFSGLVLFRLGKIDYVVRPQQALWIPFDCLSSLTIMPNTDMIEIDVSMRLTDAFPSQAGYVALSSLSEEILQRLLHIHNDERIYQPLLQVLRDELTRLHPKLTVDALTKKISNWQPDNQELERELHFALLAREARKWQQSGKAESQIINQLFAGDANRYHHMLELFYGHDDL